MAQRNYRERVEIQWTFTRKKDPNDTPDTLLRRNPLFEKKVGGVRYRIKISPSNDGKQTKLDFEQFGQGAGPTSFNDLWHVASEVLEGWAFAMDRTKSVCLDYHNCFAKQAQPTFWKGAEPRWDFLAPWTHPTTIPLQSGEILEFTIPWKLPQGNEGRLLARMYARGSDGEAGNHPHLMFSYSKSRKRLAEAFDFSTEVSLAHDLIIRAFETYFPPDAKLGFKQTSR